MNICGRVKIRVHLLFVLPHLRQKSTSLYIHYSYLIIFSDLSGLNFSDNSFGSNVFSNFTIVRSCNGDLVQHKSSVQNSVLDCLNLCICNRDKSMFHVAVNLI